MSESQKKEQETTEAEDDVFQPEPILPFSSEFEEEEQRLIYESQPPEKEHLSRLQETILRIACTVRNVDYLPIIKATNRDRVTIAQSVNSLVERHFIIKRKENPEYEKSKVIIESTYLGKDYSVRYLGVNIEDILKVEDNEHVSAFLEFIKDVSDSFQRQTLIQPLEKDFFHSLHSSNYEDWKKHELIKDKLKQALKSGIFQLIMSRNYDAEKLLNKRSIEWLKNLFSNHEIKEFRWSVIQIRDNFIETAKRFPK